ncbi:cytochrome P450 [Wilcoxina mikolae CBS 423.85]|nr:cytochrome P450 [Wilcoxina mikolae CBS 423.85]
MLLDSLPQSWAGLLATLTVAVVLMVVVAKVARNRKIYKLGKRSAVIESYFFGITETKEAFKYARMNRNRDYWTMRHEKYQNYTMEMEVLWDRLILTSEPENIKAILATQFHDYGKGEVFHEQWKPFLGDSIFTTDGKEWQGSRQLIRPQFVKDRVSDLHIFERHTQHMLRLIPRDGSTIDIADLFFRLTLDSATDFLLGESVNSLGTTGESEFAKAFGQIQEHVNDITRAGPLAVFIPDREFKKNLAVLNSFVEPFVEKTLRMRPEELKGRNETDYNFLHALAGFTRDPKVLRDQLVAVLLAGRDTTAGTLSWALFELAKRPDCVQRLRNEILDTVGPDAAPTYADLKGMKYLQHVMDETLRLYPAVPFNIRVALKDTFLPVGGGESKLEPVGVPAGTACAYSAIVMQRRTDIFGPDANEFKPERWDNWAPKPWTFIPFNGGPRICLGQQFAYTEMAYTLCRLFQNFDALLDRATQPQFERCETTISPGAGVKVALRPVEK